MMNNFYNKYLESIFDSFSFNKDDVLTINSEEEDYFSRLIATKAKEISGKGSYLNRIRDGKLEEECDIFSSFPLRDKPTVFLHVYPYLGENNTKTEINKMHSAAELQSFSLLSDPEEDFINIPFIDVPLPSPLFDNKIKFSSEDLFCKLLDLDKKKDERKIERDYVFSICEELNKIKDKKCIVKDNSGNDFSFSFIGNFFSSRLYTTKKREFYPYLNAYPIHRYINSSSLSGKIKISRPILLYGKEVKKLELNVKNGKIIDYESTVEGKGLFKYYKKEDPNAGKISKIGITNERNDLIDLPYLNKRSLEEKRGVSLTLGGTIAGNENSFVTLLLPIGSKELNIKLIEEGGKERTIYSSGMIDGEEILNS